MAIKLLAMYAHPADEDGFLRHYREVHMPLVMQVPGLEGATVNRVESNLMGGERPYFLITEMRFPDRATFDAAMASPENRAAGKDIGNFAKGLVTLLVASDHAD